MKQDSENAMFRCAFIKLVETISGIDLEETGFECEIELANHILKEFDLDWEIALHELPNDFYLRPK